MNALDRVCFEPPFRFEPPTMRRYALEPGAIVVAAVSPDANLAAFIIVHLIRRGDEITAYIVTLDVHPDHRRQGIAHRLMLQAEQQAANAGATRITLHVYTGNPNAIRFYEESGYILTVLHPHLYGENLDGLGYLKRLVSKTLN